eukprot:c28223_g4_i1 orf=1955-2242(-)
MASFGSFAGLAAAAVGLLCSHECHAIDMSDFEAAKGYQIKDPGQGDDCRQSGCRHVLGSEIVSAETSFKKTTFPKCAPQFDGIDCFETLIPSDGC